MTAAAGAVNRGSPGKPSSVIATTSPIQASAPADSTRAAMPRAAAKIASGQATASGISSARRNASNG